MSASLLESSIWLIETRTSGGIFLFSLMYCSNCDTTARLRASSSWFSPIFSSTSSACAWKNSSLSENLVMAARCPPSTNTLTVPSGSFSNCNTVPTVPTL